MDLVVLDEMSKELLKTDKWNIRKLFWTKSCRKFWIKIPSKNEWVLIVLVHFCVLWRPISWGFVINVSFTFWNSAILLIFDTCKILTTVSFWGFSFIPQWDSHWPAGGSLWFPHPTDLGDQVLPQGGLWPLELGLESLWILASTPAHYSKHLFEILQSVKNAL